MSITQALCKKMKKAGLEEVGLYSFHTTKIWVITGREFRLLFLLFFSFISFYKKV